MTSLKRKRATTSKTETAANAKRNNSLPFSSEKKEACPKQVSMRTKGKSGPTKAPGELLEVLTDLPLLKEQLSNNTWEQVSPAVDAVLAGKIPLIIPLYAVINGVLTLVKDALQPMKALEKGSKLGFSALEMMVSAWVVKLIGNMFRQSLREKDNHFFKEALTESLQSWLKTHSEEELLYAAVQTLKENVTGSFAENELASQFLYLKAVANVLSQPDLEKLISAESLEQYAAQLEKEGRADAAAHVRQAVSSMAVAGGQLRP
ncbi:MAG: hypothetical protein PWP58_1004 [Bacillota bacterium]|nr:hypothetical protein [Bacillota bacterium]